MKSKKMKKQRMMTQRDEVLQKVVDSGEWIAVLWFSVQEFGAAGAIGIDPVTKAAIAEALSEEAAEKWADETMKIFNRAAREAAALLMDTISPGSTMRIEEVEQA